MNKSTSIGGINLKLDAGAVPLPLPIFVPHPVSSLANGKKI